MTESKVSGTGTSGSPEKASPGKAARQARLAEELRANLARRKAQARSRRTGGADERPEGLSAGKSQGKTENRTDGEAETDNETTRKNRET